MNLRPDRITELRRSSAAGWIAAGQESLREHLIAQARVARQLHGPVLADSVEACLRDPACLRYPTRLVFELGEMATHQFAQPDRDPRDPEGQGRILYLRPDLRERSDQVALAVAYMIPVINYGDIVRDGDCLAYGATLLGLDEEECYRQICALADAVGAETRFQTTTVK
jgi:hypothetical protein